MSRPMRIALKAAAVGVLLGIFFVFRDNLALWENDPYLDMESAVARVFGGAIGGGVLFGLGGYTYGLFRRNSN